MGNWTEEDTLGEHTCWSGNKPRLRYVWPTALNNVSYRTVIYFTLNTASASLCYNIITIELYTQVSQKYILFWHII